MNKKKIVFLLMALCAFFVLFIGIKGRSIYNFVQRIWYIHCASGNKIIPEEVFLFTSPIANPNVSQQSVATDGKFVYVIYPSDNGTNVGVIQVYDWKGNLVNEKSGINTGHGSSSVVINDSLYILAEKEFGYKQKLNIVSLSSFATTERIYSMPVCMLWDAIGVHNGDLYFLGVNGNNYCNKKGIVRKNQPDSLSLCVFSNDRLTYNTTIAFTPNFHYENANGMAVSDSNIIIFGNSFDEKKKSLETLDAVFTPPIKNLL